MTDHRDPKSAPHAVQELVNVAIDEIDRNVAWEAVCALHWRGSRDVLEVAQDLCQQSCPKERKLGCDILGQIGVPERTFPEDCVVTLLETLGGEKEPSVLQSIFVALYHLGDERSISVATAFKNHPEEDVRHAVVLALTGHDNESALATLIELTNDPSPQVRDWATFGLGTQSAADSPAIRDALAARVNDVDADTRGEALVGLARRGDSRAVDAINHGNLPFVETDHFAQAELLLNEKGLAPRK